MKPLIREPKFLAADLDTIQRTIALLESQLAAQGRDITALQDVTTPAAPIIAQNGQVRIFKDQNGDPVNGGGSAPRIVIDPGGALFGDGTVTRPLAVQVDGSTVTINAADQLEGVMKTFTEEHNLTTYLSINTTPRKLISGVAGKVIIPVCFLIESSSVGSAGHTAGFTNGNTTWNLRWTSGAGGNLTQTAGPGNNLGLANGAGVGVTQKAAQFHSMWWYASTNPTITIAASDLYLYTGANITDPGNATASTVRLTILYFESAQSIA